MIERYFLSRDNDGHSYIIPANKRNEWYEFLEIPSDDERSWDLPDFAIELNGSPELVTFENWEVSK